MKNDFNNKNYANDGLTHTELVRVVTLKIIKSMHFTTSEIHYSIFKIYQSNVKF